MLSIRCTKEDEKMIKRYAASKNKSVSEFLREVAIEKIEEEYDLEVIREYLENKEMSKLYSAEEAEKELGL